MPCPPIIVRPTRPPYTDPMMMTPTRRRSLFVPLVLVLACIAAIGCENDQTTRALQPDDFARQPADRDAALKERLKPQNKNNPADQPTSPPAPDNTEDATTSRPEQTDPRADDHDSTTPAAPAAANATPSANADSKANPNADAQAKQNTKPNQPTYAVGGMVGQVNGQAIYAHHVFRPLHQQLRALGQKLNRAEFEDRARQLIRQRLRSLLTDQLIYGQAMRDLEERQLKGLEYAVQKHREELLRRFGRGSEAVAAEHIQQRTGKSLERMLEDYRRQLVVRRYLKQKLFPRISVSRQDIENYYHNHPRKFKPGVERKIRLIKVGKQAQAKSLAKALRGGTPFKQVATRKANQFNRSDAGLVGTEMGDEPLRGPLNETLVKLDQGQWGGPVQFTDAHWFVFCEKMTQRQGKSLREVQLKIRNQLRAKQFRRLQQDYRKELFEQGSYDSIKRMQRDLVTIALSRYATPNTNTDTNTTTTPETDATAAPNADAATTPDTDATTTSDTNGAAAPDTADQP